MRSLRTLIDALSDHNLTTQANIVFSRTSEGEKITITFEKRHQRVDDDEVDQWFEDNDKDNDQTYS